MVKNPGQQPPVDMVFRECHDTALACHSRRDQTKHPLAKPPAQDKPLLVPWDPRESVTIDCVQGTGSPTTSGRGVLRGGQCNRSTVTSTMLIGPVTCKPKWAKSSGDMHAHVNTTSGLKEPQVGLQTHQRVQHSYTHESSCVTASYQEDSSSVKPHKRA
jgi:hypothetical protein